MFQNGVYQPGVFQGAGNISFGTLDVMEDWADSAVFAGAVTITGSFSAGDATDTAELGGEVVAAGTVSANESGADTFLAAGTSDGAILIIPRDVRGGITYLVEAGAHDGTGEVMLRYASKGFVTKPHDDPPNAHYPPHLAVPGDYSRSIFRTGTTAGDVSVGAGVIELVNADGRLDTLVDHAFDGYDLTIKSVETLAPDYAQAATIFRGTVEQAEFLWRKVRLLIRDRLAVLDAPIQTNLFAGTTIAGGMDEAEGGPDDLKGLPKPLTFGAPRNVPAVESNPFDRIYSLGQSGIDGVSEVRDNGVALTASGSDYATVAALRQASIPAGQYATAKVLGLIRTGGAVAGRLTAAPFTDAAAAGRTAGQLARAILLRTGLVEGQDFLLSDIDELDALNGAELGLWIGVEERTALETLTAVLGSVGAACVPNRLGTFRIYRFDAPYGIPTVTLTEDDMLDRAGRGVERLATGDQGKGVPAWKVSIRYGHNPEVMRNEDLDVAAPAEFKAFASQDWRIAVAEDASVKTIHRLSPDLSFDTFFTGEADAQAEADRRLALYKVRRDRYRVPVKAYLVEGVDLNSVIRLRLPRFGLADGKIFRVIGIDENFETGITTLDVWG